MKNTRQKKKKREKKNMRQNKFCALKRQNTHKANAPSNKQIKQNKNNRI